MQPNFHRFTVYFIFPLGIIKALYGRSMATSNMKFICAFQKKLWHAQAYSSYFHKMADIGHFVFYDFHQNRWGFFHSRSSMAVSNMNYI